MDVSLSELQRLTGKSYRTIKKKLEGLKPTKTGQPGEAILFDSAQALEKIYSSVAGDLLNPQQEKAKLDQARRIELERKDREAKGILIDSEEVARIWTTMIVNARTKMMSIGSKLAPVLADVSDKIQIKTEIDKLVVEVLEDLAEEKVEEG